MIVSTPAAVGTIVFVLVGAYYGVRLVVDRSWSDRVDAAAHLAMSAVMALGQTAFAGLVPVAAQICGFTALTLWYVWLILFEPDAAAHGLAHHRGPWRLGYHAIMMGAMAWMAAAMTPLSPSIDAGDGMTMSMAMPALADAMAMTGSAPWAQPISVTAGAFFAVAAVVFLVTLARDLISGAIAARGGVLGAVDGLARVGMGAGMAIAFLLLMP